MLRLAIVAIMAAILEMLEPMVSFSAKLILLVAFEGTTISHPGRTFAPWATLPIMPFI